MKVKSVGKADKTASTGIATMPNDLRAKLDTLTINEALDRGIIDDLGTATGKFLVPHADPNIDTFYAIVQGYAIPCSKSVSERAAESNIDDDLIATMKFQSGVSNIEGDGFGKNWFRLTLGGVLNLDMESEDAVVLGAQPVDKIK